MYPFSRKWPNFLPGRGKSPYRWHVKAWFSVGTAKVTKQESLH
jgi:hypothetical protein